MDKEEYICISELIEKLSYFLKEHGDLPVLTEGCDCYGNAGEVDYETDSVEPFRYAIIRRTN